MPDFNALHSGKHNEEVQFCAFDVLAVDGENVRNLPLSMRKTNLGALIAAGVQLLIFRRLPAPFPNESTTQVRV